MRFYRRLPRLFAGRVLCLFLCGLLAGGHLLAAQLGAWLYMIGTYDGTLAENISETISGTKPCPYCIKVQTEERREKLPKNAVAQKTEISGLPTHSSGFSDPWRPLIGVYADTDRAALDMVYPPPVPPPKSRLG